MHMYQVTNELSKLTRPLCKESEKDLAQNVKSDPNVFFFIDIATPN